MEEGDEGGYGLPKSHRTTADVGAIPSIPFRNSGTFGTGVAVVTVVMLTRLVRLVRHSTS